MRAFKFLGLGSVGLFSGFEWPRPSGGEPAAWVEAGGPLEPCRVGVHAVPGSGLLDWMDDELWRVELGGRVIDDNGILVADRGRLMTRVVGWNADAAGGLTATCIERLRGRAVHLLRRAGDPATAHRLDVADRAEAGRIALEPARVPDAMSGAVCAALADVTCLAVGSRPNSQAPPHPDTAPSPAAIAANVAYVVAHTLAASDADMDHGAAFAAERARQLRWLADRLALNPRG